jgi:hypothetical protein
MRVPAAIAKFKTSIAVACSAVGVRSDQVVVIPGGISLPDYEVSVVLVVSEGVRVWRAVERRFVSSVGEDEEVKEYSAILFEAQIGRETIIAKRLAMRIAEMRIDVAIDSAT